jgi:hypothetical protein
LATALDKAFENIDCMSAILRCQAKNRFYESTQRLIQPRRVLWSSGLHSSRIARFCQYQMNVYRSKGHVTNGGYWPVPAVRDRRVGAGDLNHCRLVSDIDMSGGDDPLSQILKWRRQTASRGERLDDPAIGDGPAAALAYEAAKFATQRLKVGDLPVHSRQMFARDGVHRLAGTVALI